MVLNVILNEAKSPYHVIGAVMETTKVSFIYFNITRGSEVSRNRRATHTIAT